MTERERQIERDKQRERGEIEREMGESEERVITNCLNDSSELLPELMRQRA